MASVEPLFYFDFGSPNAYLSHRVIPHIEARTGIRFKYVPVLLGGLFKLSSNQSPMTAFAGLLRVTTKFSIGSAAVSPLTSTVTGRVVVPGANVSVPLAAT